MRVQFKNILCTTDFSDFSNYAVPYGIALAKEFGAKLYLCHIIDLTPAATYGQAMVDFVEQQQELTKYANEQLNKLIGEEPIDWELLVSVGHAGDDIIRQAKEKQVDLVIAATHGRSGLRRFMLGSVTERMLRTLPCPLMSVRSPEKDITLPAEKEIVFKKILVGCDFSDDSNLAFECALSLAQEYQSELHLAHVIEPPVYKHLLKQAIKTSEELRKGMRDQMNERLAKMIPEETYNWCSHITTLLAGQPHEELTKYALVNDIDLIVLGVRGHGLVEKLLVGSTTDRVVRQALCPVLSVRPMVQVG
ncbi:universal stress protein [Thermodesulfobacteriota bacterium]